MRIVGEGWSVGGEEPSAEGDGLGIGGEEPR